MKVLLVDDEEEFVTTLAERLGLRGIEADWALSGQEAVKRAGKESYDVAVVDLKMPGMSGEEVMRRLDALRPGTTFIILTGHSEGQCPAEAEAAGTCFHLVKPVDIEVLMNLIHKAAGPERGGK